MQPSTNIDQIVGLIQQELDVSKLQSFRDMLTQELVISGIVLRLKADPNDLNSQNQLIYANFLPLDGFTVAYMRAVIAGSEDDQKEIFKSWLFDGIEGFKFRDQLIKSVMDQMPDAEKHSDEAKQLLNVLDNRISEVVTQSHVNSAGNTGLLQ